jgi:DNA-binding transcriptional regulator YdaS (Cro superfamily)
MELFSQFIDTCYGGNRSAAAAALDIDPSMVSRICSGKRKVSPALAERIEQITSGRYTKEAFIWPENNNPDDAQSAAFVAENNS